MSSTSIRAHRHVCEVPAVYRVAGEEGWAPGRTVNVSDTGVLWKAAAPVALHARLEMTLHFLEPVGGFPAGQATRLGEVVRLGSSTDAAAFQTAARFVAPDGATHAQASARPSQAFIEGIRAENRFLARRIQALDREAWTVEAELQALSAEGASIETRTDDPDGYIANTRRAVFHRADCRWAVHIPAARLLTFASRRAAVAQDYASCAICRP